jgi:hypothetical protein
MLESEIDIEMQTNLHQDQIKIFWHFDEKANPFYLPGW